MNSSSSWIFLDERIRLSSPLMMTTIQWKFVWKVQLVSKFDTMGIVFTLSHKSRQFDFWASGRERALHQFIFLMQNFSQRRQESGFFSVKCRTTESRSIGLIAENCCSALVRCSFLERHLHNTRRVQMKLGGEQLHIQTHSFNSSPSCTRVSLIKALYWNATLIGFHPDLQLSRFFNDIPNTVTKH